MTTHRSILAECESKAIQFEAEALLFTGLKKYQLEGAAQAYRIVCRDETGLLSLEDLRDAMRSEANSNAKNAVENRLVAPTEAANFEGKSRAYRSVERLCNRLLDQQADDLWQHDAQRESVSLAREQKDYREDVRRGMQA